MRYDRWIGLLLVLFQITSSADFALRDGDTMVFLGDSITAARQYTKIIETYTLLRFPERKIRFVNAGKGGETARLSLERLEQAVFTEKATVLTVAYGVNDIRWGMKADEPHKKAYLDAIKELVDRCQKRGVRVFICSAAITSEDPDKAENGFLQRMCDEGLALAESKGARTIDIQRSMRAIQRRVLSHNSQLSDKSKHARLHVDDGVHLNDLGQMAMAFAILKGLGAPADVSSASIDAEKGSVIKSTNCEVSNVQRQENGITFTRLDKRLPLNLEPLWMLQGMFIPISNELNRYMLAIENLSPGNYEIRAGGRALGNWDSEALAKGINIASATADPWVPGGPWDAQAHAVKIFTDIRDELVFARRGMKEHLANHSRLLEFGHQTAEIEQRIVDLQRNVVHPVPVEFVVKRLEATRNGKP